MLDKPEDGVGRSSPQGAIYFRVPDISLAVADLKGRGRAVHRQPRTSSRPMPDHDLWMTFIRDPDGHLIGLMMEAPKGYQPPPA